MKKLLLCMLLLLVLPGAGLAETSLWEVTSGGNTLYLGGTCHILRPSDYPLPAEFDRAYQDAQMVVFEADLGQLNSPAVQQKILAGSLYRDGRTVADVLSPATFKLLQDYCREQGIPLQGLAHFKPSVLAVTLLTIELQKRGADAAGVDMNFFQRATSDGKTIGALETVDQQIDFILNMGSGNEDAFMAASLEDMQRLDEVYNRLIAAWRKGDESTLEDLTSAEARKKYPTVYRTLFIDRNRAWLPAIEEYLRTPQTELVLVGVGHMPGPDGLLSMLGSRGYRVRKME